jgi:hypothetical protein
LARLPPLFLGKLFIAVVSRRHLSKVLSPLAFSRDLVMRVQQADHPPVPPNSESEVTKVLKNKHCINTKNLFV